VSEWLVIYVTDFITVNQFSDKVFG